VTEGEAIHPDRVAEVLLKGMSSEKHFSLPERQKYFPASSPLANPGEIFADRQITAGQLLQCS
jgi:hypothetical protein